MVGDAGFERAAEMPDDLIRGGVWPQGPHHLGELTSDDVAGSLEESSGDRVDRAEPQAGVDQIDAERRLVEESLELLRAPFEGGPRRSANSSEFEIGVDSGDEFVGGEGLDEVVVGAGLRAPRPAPPRRPAPKAG